MITMVQCGITTVTIYGHLSNKHGDCNGHNDIAGGDIPYQRRQNHRSK